MSDPFFPLAPPWSRAATVHDDTDLFPQPTMDALAARFVGGIPADVSPSASASANTAALQAVVNTAQTFGANVYLPPLAAGEVILINDAIVVDDGGNIKILGSGRERTRIRQTVIPQSVFRVHSPRVEFYDIGFEGVGLNMNGAGSPAAYGAYAGVWFAEGAHYGKVYRCSGKDLHRGVRVDPTYTPEGASNDPAVTAHLDSVLIDDFISDRCWAGVTYAATKGVVVRNLRGTYLKATATDGTDVGQPPHLIYGIDRTDTFWYNHNPTVDGVYGRDSDYGKVAALKGSIGGSYTNIKANNCEGVLEIMYSRDFVASNIVSTNDIFPFTSGDGGVTGSIYLTQNTRGLLRDGSVNFVAGDYGKGLHTVSETDTVIENVSVVINRATDSTTFVAIDMKGTRVEIRRSRVFSVGAAIFAGFRTAVTGVGGRVVSPETAGNIQVGVVLVQNDSYVEYDPPRVQVNTALTNAQSVGVDPVAVNTLVRPRNKSIPNVYGDMIAWMQGDPISLAASGPRRAHSGQYAVALNGSWVGDSGGFYESANNGSGVIVWSCGYADVRCEAMIRYNSTHTSSRIGVSVRAVSQTSFIAAGFTKTGFEIIKNVSGVDTVLATAAGVGAPVMTRLYRIALEVIGNDLAAFVDGVQVATYTLTGGDITTYAGITNHGWYANRCGTTRFFTGTVRRLT